MKKDLGASVSFIPAPVFVVATYDSNGKPNAMTAAFGGVICAAPRCVYVSLRKATYTYSNLMETKAYTINIPGERYVKEADYFGIVTGKTTDKFAATGLTAVKSEFVNAPYISEFPLNLECKVIQTLDFGSHTQFVGEVVNSKIDESLLENGDLSIIEQIRPIIFDMGRDYHAIGKKIGKGYSVGKEISGKA